MQIVALGVFGIDGSRRDVQFRLGELNILTGKSKTGKSAILEIAQFCLGRDTVTIPSGVISDSASWYYILVEVQGSRILVCRPNPESASTSRAMVVRGDSSLIPPLYSELHVNADTDVVRDLLSASLGIERFVVESDARSLRSSFEVSARQALLFCFQTQGEIASKDLVFHRQSDPNIRVTIRDSLPYFLGAATPEQAVVRRQLLSARRALQRVLNEVAAMQSDEDSRNERYGRLLLSAIALGLLPDDARSSDLPTVRGLLQSVLSDRSGLEVEGAPSAKRADLEDANRSIRRQIAHLDDRVEILRLFERDQGDATRESRHQADRLKAIDLMLPSNVAHDDGLETCPLCDQHLGTPDESITDLRAVLKTLDDRLHRTEASNVRRASVVEDLQGTRRQLTGQLSTNLEELRAITDRDILSARGAGTSQQVAFLQGQISQELEHEGVGGSGLDGLRDAEHQRRGEVARLEELYEADDPASALADALDLLASQMTTYARALELEGSEYFVRLDPTELTVSVQRPSGKVPLSRMGSAENWVGYHLVTHVALHDYFVTHDRPVPRFLMFDQPTQAFFPEEVVDATEDENADWEAVRRQFVLMRDAVAARAGQLQIIVCDHANLADDWFQDSVVENWRNGLALIPTDWLDG